MCVVESLGHALHEVQMLQQLEWAPCMACIVHGMHPLPTGPIQVKSDPGDAARTR